MWRGLTEGERADLPAKVLRILQEHRGSGHPIVGLRIAQMLGYPDDRKVRMAIQILIEDGEPIAASVSKAPGYYLVETREEAEEYEAGLRSRATKTFKRLRDFQRAINQRFGVPMQPVLFEMGEDGQ